MELSEKALKRLEAAKRRIDDLGKQDVIWKQHLAEAVLALFAEGSEVTIEALRTRLLAMGTKFAMISGTEITLEATRVASETAIAHLEKAVAAHGKE